MTTHTYFTKIISVVSDLSKDLPAQQRFSRLLDTISEAFPCDAIALLKLEGSCLVPISVKGLSADTMGRRFEINNHARFAQILKQKTVLRFACDSELADPYDGLVINTQHKLDVHDCMGTPLFVDEKPWGVLTLDALNPGAFNTIDDSQLQLLIRLTEATIKITESINRLSGRLELEKEVTRILIEEKTSTEIIGASTAIKHLKDELDVVAHSHLSVLILGETGVGKELVASYIHRHSLRRKRPLVYVNCAALPINIAESELFGHVKGSYSGAIKDRAGKFEIADGATLFLDEVGELPLELQAKMLRVLQNGEIQRIGYDKHIEVDVRIIAATNRDLEQEVKNGNFRADLFHRLSVYPIKVPPLRERGRDILLLAGYFLEGNQRRLGMHQVRLDSQTEHLLLHYDWPGNVRELKHLLNRASLKASAGQSSRTGTITILPKHIGIDNDDLAEMATQDTTAGDVDSNPCNIAGVPISATCFSDPVALREATEQFQSLLIHNKLEQFNFNIAAAARDLNIDRGNFSRLIKRLGIRLNVQ